MNAKRIRRPLLAGMVAVVLLTVFTLAGNNRPPANANNIFGLVAPPFLGVARAEAVSVASTIEDEAGISAWFQASTSISLANVRGVFRTIEAETADYIIGSVPVTDYPESEDVHVYVHTDGWVLAYYLTEDPAGKIFDWRPYHDGGRTNITTKLENTIAVVASAAGVPFSSTTYYDFRYPNATHLMLIVEWVFSGTDSCEVSLPGSFAYYERSWSLAGSRGTVEYRLDGATIESGRGTWHTSQGTLTPIQLPSDQFHTIEAYAAYAYAYGGLALVYRVP